MYLVLYVMKIWSDFLLLRQLLTKRELYSFSRFILVVFLLLANSGCSPVAVKQVASKIEQLSNLLPDLSKEATFQVQVKPLSKKGSYSVTGTTNLPDDTPIAVLALRHLHPNDRLPPGVGSNPTYSILTYQDVKVKKGKWQIDLNLWKVAKDGRFQEAWQIEQPKLGLKLEPDSEVTFLATLAPTEGLWEVEERLEKQGIKIANNIIRNTVEGDRYVQASQGLSVALPTGSTAPPPERPEDLNGGWGPRYILLDEPPNKRKLEQPDKRRTDAPMDPAEFMR